MNKELREKIADLNEEAILWDNCDDAVIGVTRTLPEGVYVAVYSYEKLIEVFVKMFKEEGKSEEEIYELAVEWVDFNIVGAYVGINTPLILDSLEE